MTSETSTQTSPSPSPPRQPWLDSLVTLSDDKFTIPGTNVRFGFDALIGFLVPEVGDAITGLLGGIVLLVAWRDGAPVGLLARMAGNIAIDVGAGMIPVLGDLFDLTFRANRKNHSLLRAFQHQHYGTSRPEGVTYTLDAPSMPLSHTPSWLIGGVLLTVILLLVLLPLGFLFLVGSWLLG